MAYYLQMNGTSDWVSIPSLTFDEVIMDFSAEPIAATNYYFDGVISTNLIRHLSTGTDQFGGTFSSLSINGTAVTTGTSFLPSNTRVTMRGLVSTASITDTTALFSATTASGFMKGKLYSTKLLLDGVTVAFYDMTLGNVLDQSGNGNNATLTGGTWVSDASTTPVAGGGTLTGTGSLTATGNNNISGGAALTGLGSLTASGVNTIAGSSAMTASGSLTASGSVAISGGATLTATGSLTASGVVSILGGAIAGGATLTAVGRLTASGRVVTPKMIEYERKLAAARAGRRLSTVELIALQQLRKR